MIITSNLPFSRHRADPARLGWNRRETAEADPLPETLCQ
jgi:hypothetical protein